MMQEIQLPSSDQTTRPLLPPEMLLHVLRHLGPEDPEDRASVRRSRLVYKRLLFVCQLFRYELLPRLFERVTIEQGSPLIRRHLPQIKNDGDPCVTDPSFYVAVSNGDKHAISLAQHVRHCTFLDHRKSIGPQHSSFTPHTFDSCYLNAIYRMKNLTHLSFQNVVLDGDILVMLRKHSLQSLSMSGGAIVEPTGDASLFSELQGITQLEIRDTLLGKQPVDSLVACLTSWKPTKLSFSSIYPIDLPYIGGWTNGLQDLDFSVTRIRDLESLSLLLNSTPTITRLRVGDVVIPPDDPNDDFSVPPISLEHNALPLLRVLHCPGGWIRYFVPGRPVEEVGILSNFGYGQSRAIHTFSGMEGKLDSLLFLQESTANTERLELYSRDYISFILGQNFQPGFAAQELHLDPLTSFASCLVEKSKPSEKGKIRSLNNLRKAFQSLAGGPSSAVRRLRAATILDRIVGTAWDLPFQRQVVLALSSVAFPNTSLIQVSKWVEWRLVHPEDQDGHSTQQWKPFLSLRGDADTFQGFLRNLELRKKVVSSENSDDVTFPSVEYVDYDGFFASFLS